MNCFPCFKPKNSHSSNKEQVPVAQTRDHAPPSPQPQPKPVQPPKQNSPTGIGNNNKRDDANAVDKGNSSAKTFTFRELATATKNFRKECLLGEDGFGRLYKGTLQPSGQVVAVKQLDKNSMQGNKEFLVEILMLSLLHHPNLVNLIGYCADGDQRLLVYDYLPMGSVETHLFDITPDKKPLDWVTRMKIASGVAKGLQYLHEKANPPIIYRDLKLSNIMLDEEFNPKLFDYGLAKLGGNNTHLTPRVMGNNGYCAPEYERHGELTMKSDVYSFGVILLELITGRRALDTSRSATEQNLVTWAQPIFRDPKRFPEMADPLLGNEFPVTSLNQAVGVAAMCLQDEPDVRPLAIDVLAALTFLTVAPPVEPVRSTLPAPTPQSEHYTGGGAPPGQPVPSTPPAPKPESNHQIGDRSPEGQTVPTSPPSQMPSIDCHSGDKSDSKDEESNNKNQHVQKDNDQEDIGGSDYESDSNSVISVSDEEGHQQGKSKSIKGGSSLGHKSKTDFDIASMSSSSISSIDDESQPRGIDQTGNNNTVIKHGTSTSLKLKRKSTKKHEGTARSRSERRSNENSRKGGLGSSS